MEAPGWLSQRLADVPAGNDWLGDNERALLSGLRVEKRRADWRLGRWTAKAAVGAWLALPPQRIELLAAADGAPEAWVDGELATLSVSLSHRGGRALAAVCDSPRITGCDLELVEPRSGAFLRQWLSEAEQRLVRSHAQPRRALLANLIWAAKEASAKVRREGLRLDPRRTEVRADLGDLCTRWRRLEVGWNDRERPISGWWRSDPGWVMVVAGEPGPGAPRPLPAGPSRGEGALRIQAFPARCSG